MEYNKDHIHDQIRTTDANEIWYELHNKLTSCPKEDCWLKQIDDVSLRHKINKNIFAHMYLDRIELSKMILRNGINVML